MNIDDLSKIITWCVIYPLNGTRTEVFEEVENILCGHIVDAAYVDRFFSDAFNS